MFINVTAQDWKTITAPKLRGAWNMHELAPQDLDFFVSLGSIVGRLGNVGQSIYAGTSTFLDKFSRYRNRLGLPAVTVSLPAVVGIRYAADQQINDQLKSSLGLTMDEQQVYTAVKGAIIGPSSGLNTNGCSLVATVIPSNEIRPWQHFNPTYGLSSAVPDSEGTGSKPGRNKTSTLMADVRSSSEPLEYLQGALKDKVSVMTMINRDDIHIARSLAELGLDSLVSVELRNWIRREFGAELPLTAIMGAGNLKGLSEKILALMPVKA